jgi:hypothetical protein
VTVQAFKSQMSRLDGLKFAPVTLDTHWEALSDLTSVELDAAVTRSARECDEYPSPRMLRAFVDEYRGRVEVPEEDPDRVTAIEPMTIEIPQVGLKLPVTREWRYYCEDCNDTGVRSYWCGSTPSTRWPWLSLQFCQRRNEHGTHEWAGPCPCAETNPDVQRKRARAQQVSRKTAER